MKEIVSLLFCGAFALIMIKAVSGSGINPRKKECQYCHKMIPYSASICPYCHRYPRTDVGAEAKGTLNLIVFFVKAAVLLVVFYFICSLFGIV